MTIQSPHTLLVMINDEKSAGRIVVELDAFVRFNLQIDLQLVELESRWPHRLSSRTAALAAD